MSDTQPVYSVAKTMNRLMSVSANRSCADCRSVLVDPSQVYASVSPKVSSEGNQRPHRVSNFRQNHASFAPPGQNTRSVPKAFDPPVDPALVASTRVGGHGVFVCALCGAAHKLLGQNVAIVHSVQDVHAWSIEEVQIMNKSGGNARSWAVLEAFVPHYWESKRPKPEASVADRLTFIRAKYEALAFVLPQSGPLAVDAWKRIIDLHQEWRSLPWGNDLYATSEYDLGAQQEMRRESALKKNLSFKATFDRKRAELPDRLVDYFCVVTPSDYLDPSLARKNDLSHLDSPEAFVLTPKVVDCFPLPNTYGPDHDFPEHVSTFLFPDGCRPKTLSPPPSFFTFVLTTSSGDRLYGGSLRVYDDHRDIEYLKQVLENSNFVGKEPPWLSDRSDRSISLGTSSRSDVSWNSDIFFLPKCLVVLSHYPFFDLWRKFLLKIYRIALVEAPLPIERFIANFTCEIPLPPPGKVQIKFGFTVKDIWCIQRPAENQLPLADFSFKPLFASLSVSNVLVVFACLLQETRVALLSRHYSILCPVAEALTTLLFPLRWDGMYVPIMPYALLDILDAPVPFLVGLDARYLIETRPQHRPHGVVFVDLDKDEVHLGFEEGSNSPRQIPCLPDRQAAKLKAKLEEFGSSIYVPPPSGKIGTVTQGSGNTVPLVRKASYLLSNTTETRPTSMKRRRDVFGTADKAYRDSELQIPISGFLSEHGQLYEREVVGVKGAEVSPKHERHKFPVIRRRGLQRSRSSDSVEHFGDIGSILDLEEPPHFSSREIREAFLRFFVSVLRDYRQFYDGDSFRSDEFVANIGTSSAGSEFMRVVVRTQMFEAFVEEHRENTEDPEVRFFEASIQAKLKRSKKNALASLGRVGKSESSSYLEDRTSSIRDTFTPPPPSNWGLPDDGRTYSYGSFPPLNPDLYGKLRPPRKFVSNRRGSLRVSRRASVATKASEHAVFAKAMSPVLFRPGSSIIEATKRGAKNLEYAINALSTPFAGQVHQSRVSVDAATFRASTISDVTVPSDLGMSDDLLSTAEEVVLNARRKQSLLLGIMMKLQSSGRRRLVGLGPTKNASLAGANDSTSNFETFRLEAELNAVLKCQACVRSFVMTSRYRRIRRAVTKLQTFARQRKIRFIFLLVRNHVIQIQSAFRRFTARKLLKIVVAGQMDLYRRHIFNLWEVSHTSLCYRTKLWAAVLSNTCLRMGIARDEILRLWEVLNIRVPYHPDNRDDSDAVVRSARKLDCPILFYLQVKTIEYVDSVHSMVRKSAEKGMAEQREVAERIQVYERLSSVSDERLLVHFGKFAVALRDRKKKVSLAELLWKSYPQATASAALMVELFPELEVSTNILYRELSSKVKRRFTKAIAVPKPLERDMWAHEFLSNRIRANIREVADVSIRIVPKVMARLEKVGSRDRAAEVEHLYMIAPLSDPKDTRAKIISSFLDSGRSVSATFTANGASNREKTWEVNREEKENAPAVSFWGESLRQSGGSIDLTVSTG